MIDAKPEWLQASKDADFKLGERVFHDKFGYGLIKSVDGDKLAIIFETASKKNAVGSLLERA